MNYTNFLLIVLGLFGVLMHNLVELNKLNKASGGNLKIVKYLKIEMFSIMISICVVIVCVIVKQEIQQLERVGNWLGLAFIAIGYMGQSLLIFAMGRANKVIDKPDN
jgi:hypothetical protein